MVEHWSTLNRDTSSILPDIILYLFCLLSRSRDVDIEHNDDYIEAELRNTSENISSASGNGDDSYNTHYQVYEEVSAKRNITGSGAESTVVYRDSAHGRLTIQRPKSIGGRLLGKNLQPFAQGTIICTRHCDLHTACTRLAHTLICTRY